MSTYCILYQHSRYDNMFIELFNIHTIVVHWQRSKQQQAQTNNKTRQKQIAMEIDKQNKINTHISDMIVILKPAVLHHQHFNK